MYRTCSTRPWKWTRMYPCRYTCVEDSTRMYRVRVSCIRNGFKGYRIYVLKANLVAKIGSLTRLHIIFRQIGQIRNTKNDFISRKWNISFFFTIFIAFDAIQRQKQSKIHTRVHEFNTRVLLVYPSSVYTCSTIDVYVSCIQKNTRKWPKLDVYPCIRVFVYTRVHSPGVDPAFLKTCIRC